MPAVRPKAFQSRTLGWWAIDPVTGWTEDVTETGRHGQPTEYMGTIVVPTRAASAFCRYGWVVAMHLTTVSQVLQLLIEAKLVDLPRETTELLKVAEPYGPGVVSVLCEALLMASPRVPRMRPPLPPMPPKVKPRLPPPPDRLPYRVTKFPRK